MTGVQFWCTKEFLFWEDNKLIAHYVPGLRYNCDPSKPKHDRLHVLLFGGVLPATLPVYIEELDTGVTTKYEAGDAVPGWIAEGRFSLTDPAERPVGGSVSGSAEIGG